MKSPKNRNHSGMDPARLEELRNRLLGDAVKTSQTSIQARKQRDPLLPSFAQEQLWFVDSLLEPAKKAVYNVPYTTRVNSELDPTLLWYALQQIVRDHEILRSEFTATENGVCVRIPDVQVPLQVADFSTLDPQSREASLGLFIRDEIAKPFDLSKGPMIRALLVRCAPSDYVVHLTIHHIVSDGWSLGILHQHLWALYNDFAQGGVGAIAAPAISYYDYAQWLRDRIDNNELSGAIDFWKTNLENVPHLLDLPFDRERASHSQFSGATYRFTLPTPLATRLNAVAKASGTTVFAFLMSAFQLQVSRLTSQSNFLIGTPVANRLMSDTEKLIGLFASLIPIRAEVDEQQSFETLLKQVKTQLSDAFSHQEVPFDILVDLMQPERSQSYNPLVQVVFAYQNHTSSKASGEELPETIGVTAGARFDLVMALVETEAGLYGEFEYNTELFDASAIQTFAERYCVLLDTLLEKPGSKLHEISFLTEPEELQIVHERNETTQDFDESDLLTDLMREQTAQRPDGEALKFGSQSLSFKELDLRSNQLANLLIEKGCKPGKNIGVLMERSLSMVVSLQAILKAGGAYLPLDTDWPADRIAYVINDASIDCVITETELASLLKDTKVTTLCLEDSFILLEEQPEQAPEVTIQPEDLAYIIYTSGSTGAPKGVMVSHRAICNRLLWMREAYAVDLTDRILQKTPYTFDVSVWEFFLPAISGAALVIAKPNGHKEPAYLEKLLAGESISMIHFVPAMLRAFLYAYRGRATPSLKHVICSGEALPPDLVEEFYKAFDCRLHNLYGPTEAAVDVTFWECPRGQLTSVPIGKPISNIQTYILDQYLRPVPDGVIGRLFLAGVGLARGYLGKPELTAERFLPNPFVAASGARMYDTGDLARYNKQGEIEFIGRNDGQVKLRGLRIELDEIDACLRSHPDVEDCVTSIVSYDDSDQRLIAYIVPNRETAYPVWNWANPDTLSGEYAYTHLPNGMRVFSLNQSETEFLYQEIFEEQTYELGHLTLKAGDSVIDIGANIGMFSLYAAQHCPGLRLFSFEPASPVFEILQKNLSLYGLDSAAFREAVGKEVGTVEFTYYPNVSILSGCHADLDAERAVLRTYFQNESGQSSSSERLDSSAMDAWLDQRLESTQVSCPVTTISEIIRANELDSVALLKIDAEKSELDILAGIEPDDWRKIRQLVLEVHDDGETLTELTALLSDKGFEIRTSEVSYDRMVQVVATRAEQILTKAKADAPAMPVHYWSEADYTRQLKKHLAKYLPDYMVPRQTQILAELPIGRSGKLDRRTLPKPEISTSEADQTYGECAAQSQYERQIMEIWQDVLKNRLIERNSKFFDVGGHSLLAIQILVRIRNLYDLQLPLDCLFNYPRFSEFCNFVESKLKKQSQRQSPSAKKNSPNSHDVVDQLSDQEIEKTLELAFE